MSSLDLTSPLRPAQPQTQALFTKQQVDAKGHRAAQQQDELQQQRQAAVGQRGMDQRPEEGHLQLAHGGVSLDAHGLAIFLHHLQDQLVHLMLKPLSTGFSHFVEES